MEVGLFEDAADGETEPKVDCPEDIGASEEEISSTQQGEENFEDRFDDDCETLEAGTVVVDLTDDENETSRTSEQQFKSLLTWLQEYFELNLQTKLTNLVDFTLCEQCKNPINDIFDMVFVEQFHLVCYYKFHLGQDLSQEHIASIQMLKINLFQAFKSVRATNTLIRSHPEFRLFLESLKSDISKRVCLECGQSSDNIQDHVHQEHSPTSTRPIITTKKRYQCRFCSECFKEEYLQLRHEMQHPDLVKEKYSGMMLRNEQFLCPYCRVRFDKSHRMQQHLEAHEKAIKFSQPKRLRTYPAVTVRARRKVTVKSEADQSKRPYSLRCYSKSKYRHK
ncbi:hypothetical protein RP20_CCG025487 [Aedes albopictus]|nr:hypothetical protein RP20_CCG025487 [Aedes albopictus]